MDSTNADALYVRGLCLYYEDCIEKAVQFFVQALRMAPDHEKACVACRVSSKPGVLHVVVELPFMSHGTSEARAAAQW
jgi:hypothetical protein